MNPLFALTAHLEDLRKCSESSTRSWMRPRTMWSSSCLTAKPVIRWFVPQSTVMPAPRIGERSLTPSISLASSTRKSKAWKHFPVFHCLRRIMTTSQCMPCRARHMHAKTPQHSSPALANCFFSEAMQLIHQDAWKRAFRCLLLAGRIRCLTDYAVCFRIPCTLFRTKSLVCCVCRYILF